MAVVVRRQQDLAFQPMELCLPVALAAAFDLSVGFGQPLAGRLDAAGVKPAMAKKEIWIYLLAYNLIRVMMAQAAALAECLPRQLSFKHTVQLWIHRHRSGRDCDEPRRTTLLILIAQQRAGNRPGRIEPRAVKRRNKPTLNQSPLGRQSRGLKTWPSEEA